LKGRLKTLICNVQRSYRYVFYAVTTVYILCMIRVLFVTQYHSPVLFQGSICWWCCF